MADGSQVINDQGQVTSILSMSRVRPYDIAILGGGAAGCAAAITLARSGRRVALVERSNRKPWRVPQTLAPQARAVLSQLGVWDSFQSIGAVEFPGIISTWGRSSPSEYDFCRSVFDTGWHINRPSFDAMLLEQCEVRGAEVIHVQSVGKLRRSEGRWQLHAHSKNSDISIDCHYLIDATGHAAWLAIELGAKREHLDTLASFAICAPVAADAYMMDPRLVIEAVESGWWYLSPAVAGECNCVLMTDPLLIPGNRRDRIEYLASAFRQTIDIRARVGFENLNRLRVTVAHSSRLQPVTGRNWLAIGDAAMTCDPLSGQGIHNALATGVRGAEAANRSLEGDLSPAADYAHRMDGLWADFVRQFRDFYGAEERWPNSPFWRQRRERMASPRSKKPNAIQS